MAQAKSKGLFELQWQHTLTEYITAIAWSSQGVLAVSSADGEVLLWQDSAQLIQSAKGTSVNALAFSPDGQFLACGGQGGQISIWSVQKEPELVAQLENGTHWIDSLAWSPTQNWLAYNLGRHVQVWDADTQSILTTLAFESSSVLALDWQPNGENLALAGDAGVKIWSAQDWEDDPYILTMPSASTAIAWSRDSLYLASGNLDYTITVLQWSNPHPWVMRGFPGKIRNLAWSKPLKQNAPLLAASSIEGIVVWTKQLDDLGGWDAKVLDSHEGIVQDIAFSPENLLLASVSEDGWLYLWQNAKQLAQKLQGTADSFSCLAWDYQGQQLAAGGQNGEILVWSQSKRGRGFGR